MGDDRTIRTGTRRGCTRRVCRWAPRRTFKLTVLWGCRELTLWYKPRRGYTPARLLVTGRDGRVTETIFPSLDYRPMKKRVVGAKTTSEFTHLAPMESKLFGQLHNLVKHLAVTKYDDGEPRTPGTWMAKTLGTAYVLVLKDPDACAQMQVTAPTIDDAFVMADLMLGSEEAPWEVDPWAVQRNKKSKK